MLLRMSDWERIREHFTEEEKDLLNKAITGEVICPRGCTIDEENAGAIRLRGRRGVRRDRQRYFNNCLMSAATAGAPLP